jgi:hypothetical protein
MMIPSNKFHTYKEIFYKITGEMKKYKKILIISQNSIDYKNYISYKNESEDSKDFVNKM